MDMAEIRMILAVRALRKLLNKGERGDGDELVAIVENKPMTRKNHARVAEYLRDAGWKGPIGAAAAHEPGRFPGHTFVTDAFLTESAHPDRRAAAMGEAVHDGSPVVAGACPGDCAACNSAYLRADRT